MKKNYNIFLILQSLAIGFLIFLMVHPSRGFGRLIGFILGFAVFYGSWRLFPYLVKRQIDFNKFSLLFLLSLSFPYYLLREYHFVALIFVSYYLLAYLFVKYTSLSESMIILLLIISLSFSILHINMNPEYTKARLEKSLSRTIEGPPRYRILLPELMNLTTAITGLRDLFGLMIIFRFVSFALVLLSTHLLVVFVSNNHYLSIFLPLLYVFMIPFSWDVLYVTDFPEIFLSTIFIYNMLKKNYAWASAFFVLGALNRDTIVFNLVFFVFYTLLKAPNPIKNSFRTIKNNKKIFLVLLGLLLSLVVLKLIIIKIYEKTWLYENQLKENLYSLKEYTGRFERFNFQDYIQWSNRIFKFLMFSGGIYLLIMLFFKKIPSDFLTSFLFTFLLFIPLFLYIGNISETRILYIFYPYTMICLAYILKGDFSKRQ